MTMDTAGMIRPKTVEGTTANLAAYLINNQPTPDNSMAPTHRCALESLAILGDKLTHRKEKSTHHRSGSKHRSSSKPVMISHRVKLTNLAIDVLHEMATTPKKLRSTMESSVVPIV
jgi:hypothetical protein